MIWYIKYIKTKIEGTINMERLKVLGTWVLLVILFYLFSNGMIYLFLHKGEKVQTQRNNNQVVNQSK